MKLPAIKIKILDAVHFSAVKKVLSQLGYEISAYLHTDHVTQFPRYIGSASHRYRRIHCYAPFPNLWFRPEEKTLHDLHVMLVDEVDGVQPEVEIKTEPKVEPVTDEVPALKSNLVALPGGVAVDPNTVTLIQTGQACTLCQDRLIIDLLADRLEGHRRTVVIMLRDTEFDNLDDLATEVYGLLGIEQYDPPVQRIEWSGGKRAPVMPEGKKLNTVHYSNGVTTVHRRGFQYRWNHTGSPDDIVSYTVTKV